MTLNDVKTRISSKSYIVTKFNHQKMRFYLNKTIFLCVFLSQRPPRIMSSADIIVRVACAFLLYSNVLLTKQNASNE